MTNLTDHRNNELRCPLGQLTETLDDASNFYRRRDQNGPNDRVATGWDDPQDAACRKVITTACGDGVVNMVCVNGICWRRKNMPEHQWVSADVSPDPSGGQRSHYHTTFDLNGHTVHVDFIKRSSSGPGSGVHDTQFFVDGQFVSRGGHAFTVPARIPRGEPAAMRWRDYLLICKNNIDHWSTPHPSWFTLWKRDRGYVYTTTRSTESQLTLFPTEYPDQPRTVDRTDGEADRFKLHSGEVVWVESIEQRPTYGGMLEGYPNRKLNERILKRTVDGLRGQFEGNVVLIDPPMTTKPEEPMSDHGPWMELPAITCTAKLRSHSIGELGSRLTLVWYQSRFAMPIDAQVLRKIKSLNWKALAEAIDL